MGKKARRKEQRSKHEVAHGSSHRAREAATSSSWPDMPSRSGSSDPEQSPVSWRRRRPAPPAKTTRQGRPVDLRALFGTWQLPPQPRPPAKASEAVSVCVARHQRREVLFANGRTGQGSLAPRKKFTNKRCK